MEANDRIGVAVKKVIQIATAASRPLAIEKLDFASKKKELRDSGVRYARMLSHPSYARIHFTIQARAFDAGIDVHAVSPAYTSVIGRNKFARRYGLSSHGAAALVIARRALKLSERPNPHSDPNTSPVPVRKRGEHVWSFWAKVLRRERRCSARWAAPKERSHLSLTAQVGPSLPVQLQLPVANPPETPFVRRPLTGSNCWWLRDGSRAVARIKRSEARGSSNIGRSER